MESYQKHFTKPQQRNNPNYSRSGINSNNSGDNSSKNSAKLNPTQTYLLSLLESLGYVEQCPHYHPEGDALYHSLQTFELARLATADQELWAAALFHDIGKSIDNRDHAYSGAELLKGMFSSRVTWLVEHHMDLILHPAKTRKRWRNTTHLTDLEKLRKYDVSGRRTDVEVCSPQQAIISIKFTIITKQSD